MKQWAPLSLGGLPLVKQREPLSLGGLPLVLGRPSPCEAEEAFPSRSSGHPCPCSPCEAVGTFVIGRPSLRQAEGILVLRRLSGEHLGLGGASQCMTMLTMV